MFTVEERSRIRDRIIDMGREDDRVVAGATVGSMALGPGDRWSDLDLTFGLAEAASIEEVLADWTDRFEREFGAVHLFDLPVSSTIYRVFLFPGNLQVDVSFTPGHEFGARGPKFALLFGTAVERPRPPQPSADEMLGLAVHHAVRARFCIERGKLWQAEYWISAIRDQALALACLARGLETSYGRGFDALPSEVRDGFADTLVRSMDGQELARALRRSIDGLLRESSPAAVLSSKVDEQLRELADPTTPDTT